VKLEEVVHGDQVLLAPLRATDADELMGLLQEPALRQWLRADDVSQLRERFRGWESRRSPDGQELWLNWVVRSPGSARALGWVQATVRGKAATVAYAVLPAQRRKGVAVDALRAMIRWLHDRLGVSLFTAEIDDANAASVRVARAAGLTRTEQRVDDEAVWSLSLQPSIE
jgi:RimJ/RimL family protein N-acetyltransferase